MSEARINGQDLEVKWLSGLSLVASVALAVAAVSPCLATCIYRPFSDKIVKVRIIGCTSAREPLERAARSVDLFLDREESDAAKNESRESYVREVLDINSGVVLQVQVLKTRAVDVTLCPEARAREWVSESGRATYFVATPKSGTCADFPLDLERTFFVSRECCDTIPGYSATCVLEHVERAGDVPAWATSAAREQ